MFYYCICPVCVCVLFVFCLMFWYTTAALLFLVPRKSVVGIIHLLRYPKPPLFVEGIFGLGTRLLPDQFPFLISSHYCWGTGSGTQLLSDQQSTGVTHHCACCPNSVLGSATLLEPHTNPVRSSRAHPRGCSRAPFPVDVPSIGAAAAALMGMVILLLFF